MHDHSQKEGVQSLDYLVANLLEFFRDPRNEQRFFEAAKIAINQVSRMTSSKVSQLEKRYMFFASKLKNDLSPTSLRIFAHECLESANKSGLITSITSKNNDQTVRSLHKKAKHELSSSLALGHSESSAIQRAANVLVKEKRKIDLNEHIKNLTKTHPLKETLEILTMQHQQLAKEDIKNQLLRLRRNQDTKAQGMLYRLLEKTQAFSTRRLHFLLGDELFFLCRPLGFLDPQSTILIIEVPTNAHLHALTYRKLEILTSLKKDLAFKTVKTLRFKVKGGTF